MFSIITLPSGFVDDISTNASDLVTDLSPYITLIIGVLLAVLVISFIIHAIKS
ncbi:hypothetical protein LCGC14_1369330 [marine sediment metagenome]|uniref:Uncharacterized protein n=1 Tax=marine sediment metagenome TaxID=412755 RepID=A0A0F9K678_9ZZZZ